MVDKIDLTKILDPEAAKETTGKITPSKLKDVFLEIEKFINNKMPRGAGEALLADGSNQMDGDLDLNSQELDQIANLVGNDKNWRYTYDSNNNKVIVQENTGSLSQPTWKDRLTIDFANFLVSSQNFEGDENKVIELKGKDSNDDQKWRMKYFDADDEWRMQENTGTDSSPNWKDRMTFDYGNLNQIAQNVEANEDMKKKKLIGKDSNGDPAYRMLYDDNKDKWRIQENTGTAGSPTWTDRSDFDFGDLKFNADNVEAKDDVNTKVLMGKDPNNDPKWRMKYDSGTDRWLLQQNTGTAGSPTWTNRMQYDFSDLKFLSDEIDSKEGNFRDGGSGVIKVDNLRLQSFLGMDTNNNLDWRINYDQNNNHIEFQENTGTNNSPTWVDRFAFELKAGGQVLLKDNTGIVFPDGSELHSDDLDGSGRVANVTSTYKGNDIDSDGDGTVDKADNSTKFSGTSPSDGNDGDVLKTTGSDTEWGTRQKVYRVDSVVNHGFRRVKDGGWNQNYGNAVADDGNIFYGVNFGGSLNKNVLTNPYDTQSWTKEQSFDLTNLSNFGFSDAMGCLITPDNKTIYVGNDNESYIVELTLSTANDLSTASENNRGSWTNQGRDMAWGDNGNKVYVTGGLSDTLKEYDLTTPYDLSTASLVNSKTISAANQYIHGVTFVDQNNGRKLLLGEGHEQKNEQIYYFELKTPWDISTRKLIKKWDTPFTDSADNLETTPNGDKIFAIGDDSSDNTALHEISI